MLENEVNIDLGQVEPIKGVDYYKSDEVNEFEEEIKNDVSTNLDNTYETTENKTNVLNESSTNNQYPNAEITFKEFNKRDKQLDYVDTCNKGFRDGISITAAEGEFLNLTDSSNLPIKDFAMSGNATQADTPTPSTPQDIHVVTGDNTVKIANKNILLMENDAKTWRTNRWSFSKGLLTFNNTDAANVNNLVGGKIANVNIPSGTKITLSMKYISGSLDNESATSYFRFGIRVLFDDNTTLDILMPTSSSYNYANYKTAGTLTYTTSASTLSKKVIGIYIKPNTGYYAATNFTCQVQVEIGENATDWVEPSEQTQLLSLGSIELAKIGNYTDRIFKDSGKWYVEKNIGKVVLDGTQAIKNVNWRASETSVGWLYYYGLTNNALVGNRVIGDVKANKLTATSYYNMYEKNVDNGIGVYTDGTFGLVVRVANTSLTTAEAINAYLSTNPITVYYALATPTITEITDQTLLAQLDNLMKIPMNKGTTNIFTTTENDNPILEVTYYKDLGTLFQNVQNAITYKENI